MGILGKQVNKIAIITKNMETWSKKQRRSKSTHKMDCGPKYSKVSESLRYITSGSVQCSMFCGGRQCKYEGQAKWSDSEMVIKGLYSSWATDNILAMARPSTRTINKFNVIEQFHRWGITALINLQHPGEHANCGFGLENSGFTYNPEEFMNSGIFFYNFIWQDYGVRSLESVLDIVKVMDFALQSGKVAVHCHAGLGRTGVLIACYLIYSSRITPEEAIHIVRIKRPRSVQTRGQISCVQEFSKFLKPAWVIFPSCFEVKPFTLQKYLVRQKHVLHGYEARELKFIPKIIFVTCKRLLELCRLDANKLRLTSNCPIGKPDDEIDSTDDDDELESSINNSNENTCDISASMEDLKGEFDTRNMSSNEDCSGMNKKISNSQPLGCMSSLSNEDCDGINKELSNSQSFGCMTQSSRQKSESDLCVEYKTNTKNDLELLQEDAKSNEVELSSKILNEEQESSSVTGNKANERITVDDVAAAIGGNNHIDDDVIAKVESLQRLLNDSNKGWKVVEEETNISILITLMVSWIDCLMEPVLSLHDVESLIGNKENPQEALLGLSKSQRGICECLFVTIFKLNPIDKDLRKKALFRIITILTQDKGVIKDDCTRDASFPSGTESGILSSSLMKEFLAFSMLLYENWLN